MKKLNLMSIFIFDFKELFSERFYGLIFSSDLLIFIIYDSLESIYGLLSSLSNFHCLLFIVLFLIFLTTDESSSVVTKLTGSKFSLHEEVRC